MLIDNKPKEYTLNHFLKAFEASKGETNNNYKDELTLVGTYWENPIEKPIISANYIEVIEDVYVDEEGNPINVDGVGLTLKTFLKPDEADQKEIETLAPLMNYALMGDVYRETEQLEGADDSQTSSVATYFNQGTILSNISDYVLLFNVTNDNVKRYAYKIASVQYYLYELEGKPLNENFDTSQKLYVLFKNKEYDGERFLSSFIHQDLTKNDGVKILKMFAERNITGMFIGSVMTENLKEQHTANAIHGISSLFNIFIEEQEKGLLFDVGSKETHQSFHEKDIKSVDVRFNANIYSLIIDTKYTRITLFID